MEAFKLLKLPSLAVRHILRIMHPSDLFKITLFFPIFRFFAKSIYQKSAKLYIDSNDERFLFLLFFQIANKTFPIIKFADAVGFIGSKKVKIGGEEFEILFKFSSNTPEVHCLHRQKNALWRQIKKNLVEIFGGSPSMRVAIHAEMLGNLPKIGLVQKVTVKSVSSWRPTVRVKSKYLEKLLEYYAITKNAYIGPEIVGKIKMDSSLLGMNSLAIDGAQLVTIDHVLQYNGRFLFLKKTPFRSQCLIQFLNSWIQGSHENLESMMFSGAEEIDVDLVLTVFRDKFKRFDPRKHAQVFENRSEYNFDETGRNGDYDCSDAWDIERPSDGHLASVKISPTRFFFFVWKNSSSVVSG